MALKKSLKKIILEEPKDFNNSPRIVRESFTHNPRTKFKLAIYTGIAVLGYLFREEILEYTLNNIY